MHIGKYCICTQQPLSLMQVTGTLSTARTVSVVVRGSNKLVLEEADRSLHDALCVIRCLVKNRYNKLYSMTMYVSLSCDALCCVCVN